MFDECIAILCVYRVCWESAILFVITKLLVHFFVSDDLELSLPKFLPFYLLLGVAFRDPQGCKHSCRLVSTLPRNSVTGPRKKKETKQYGNSKLHCFIKQLLLFLSASLYVSKRGAYWDRLCRDVVGRWLVGRWSLVVTRVHCGQTVHPRPIVTMEH